MNFHISQKATGFFLLLFFISYCSFTHGQSLIAGIPSADVAHKQKLEWTHESQIGIKNSDIKWNSFNFLCYGIADQTELTVSLLNVDNDNSRNLVYAAGAKRYFNFLNNGKFNLRLTTGGNLLLKKGYNAGHWVYSHLSLKSKKLKTRITAGISSGTHHLFGKDKLKKQNGEYIFKTNQTTCFIGGFEQPLNKKYSLLADWYSGDHELAAFIAAGQINFGKNNMIIGYKIPNYPSEINSNAIIIEFLIVL